MCTVDEIAAVLNCSRDVIFDRFSDAIKKGRENGRASLRRHQYAAAQKGNATMLIWLGKQHLGQTDKLLPLDSLTDDELRRIIAGAADGRATTRDADPQPAGDTEKLDAESGPTN